MLPGKNVDCYLAIVGTFSDESSKNYSYQDPSAWGVVTQEGPISGVLLHNENKLDEMGKILEHLMTFVPTLPSEGELTLPNGSRIEFDNTSFSKILLGGDQLTVARVRGTAVKFYICGAVGIIIQYILVHLGPVT